LLDPPVTSSATWRHASVPGGEPQGPASCPLAPSICSSGYRRPRAVPASSVSSSSTLTSQTQPPGTSRSETRSQTRWSPFE
jgi:hypothetical protein